MKIYEVFQDLDIKSKIQKKLLELFQLAEIDNSRDGKLTMDIGSTRERIIIAMLIYKFGEENITTNIPITANETDVIIFKEPVSIKTVISKKIVGVKLIWTVDSKKAINELVKHRYTKSISISWLRNDNTIYNPYGRWVDMWKK